MLNRRRLLFSGAAIAAVTAASVPFAFSGDSPAGEEVIAWLKANAVPLATTEPGSGFQDIEFLRPIIGRARIVSIGEATHGTSEFFQIRHRLIEYCVSQLGFSMIGLEAMYGEEQALNDYVLDGKGSAADLMAGMISRFWQNKEMIAILEWVRAWNLANERKVKFYGFDMLRTKPASDRLLGYLKRLAPDLAAAIETSLAPNVVEDFATLSGQAQGEIVAQIKHVLNRFDTERMTWTARSSELEWRLARQCAVIMEQLTRRANFPARSSFRDQRASFRDQCMADNVSALLEAEGPQTKALLLAHNEHVQRAPVSWFSPVMTFSSMGNFLHARFGAEQAVIGFSFNQGSFRAVATTDSLDPGSAYDPRMHEWAVGAAPAHFVDAALARTGLPLFALNLKAVPQNGPVAQWMASKPWQRAIGLSFSHGTVNAPPPPIKPYQKSGDPRDRYDVLVFVESTTATHSIPRRAKV
jgi:erythromycin esterase